MATKIKSEKVTITIPSELKERLNDLKEELNTSVSSIYKEALEDYLESREIKRWERGAKLAQKDKRYIDFVEEISHGGGDIYEY
jgi:predicted transcriptional regulator